MAELVADCPRCGAKRITFDLMSEAYVSMRHNWQKVYEAFCICRHCNRSTVFILFDAGIDESKYIEKFGLSKVSGSVNPLVRIQNHISQKDQNPTKTPEHLPEEIQSVFVEGATCLAVGCFNASATMFRLCVDLATKGRLPEEPQAPNAKIRRNLGLRLEWLFENKILPDELKELSSCIKEDGNDGAHEGTLKEEDAEDLLDFTTALLERLYTEPERLKIAKERRDQRRGK